MPKPEAKFCRNCGTPMQRRVPPLEDRTRAVCPNCGFIDYVNPINVVGTIPVWQGDQVLLCRRAIEPRRGWWTLPAGFLETGESSSDGAIRETTEEAGARVDLLGLYSVLDVVHAEQVHLFWRATLRDTDFDPGVETLECQLFPVEEIPWDELAFRTVRTTLEHWVADRAAGEFNLHYGVIDPPPTLPE